MMIDSSVTQRQGLSAQAQLSHIGSSDVGSALKSPNTLAELLLDTKSC